MGKVRGMCEFCTHLPEDEEFAPCSICGDNPGWKWVPSTAGQIALELEAEIERLQAALAAAPVCEDAEAGAAWAEAHAQEVKNVEYPEFHEDGRATCPCGGEMIAQWDTVDDEPCWECQDCGAWYTVGGDLAYDGTSVPLA